MSAVSQSPEIYWRKRNKRNKHILWTAAVLVLVIIIFIFTRRIYPIERGLSSFCPNSNSISYLVETGIGEVTITASFQNNLSFESYDETLYRIKCFFGYTGKPPEPVDFYIGRYAPQALPLELNYLFIRFFYMLGFNFDINIVLAYPDGNVFLEQRISPSRHMWGEMISRYTNEADS